MNTLPLAPVADRAMVLTSMLLGLASLHTARPHMHIEWDGNDSPVLIRRTDGWTLTLDLWTATLTDLDSDVIVTDTEGDSIQILPPMAALILLHNVIMREENRV